MDNALFARSLMGISLGFHILFAMAGIAMPLLMTLAEAWWRRTGDEQYLALAKSWARGTAGLFAVGAVSGTVLSFALGLLFPEFMRQAGPIVGWAFGVEGFAFFAESIFLGVYIYGWQRVSPRLHLFAGAMVAASGPTSAVIVTIANAWMNTPTGFKLVAGRFTEIQPLAILAAPAVAHEVAHTLLSCYMGACLAVAAIHALVLLRAPRARSGFHAKALGLALGVALPVTLLQPVIGHFAGQRVARYQPMKLAAMEGQLKTESAAPLRFGPVRIPGLLSFLAFNDFTSEVKGLEEIPREDWPPSAVAPSFQLMFGLGTLLACYAVWALWRKIRKRAWEESRPFLMATLAAGPLALIAVEAGWMVTELGRQPWTIYGVMRTAETITPVPSLWVPFVVFTLIYLGLAAAVVLMIKNLVRASMHPDPTPGVES
jgi:cytochrome d ubiquinol oxidase subunit I